MTDTTKTSGAPPETVHFANRLASSDNFEILFREGMALVEETAVYLDGSGRQEAKALERPASLAYAAESMRLTSRLMQLASWLLLQRAVNEGEMSREQAGNDKNKVDIEKLSTPATSPAFDDLPENFKTLIQRSIRLQERIVHLDTMLYRSAEPAFEAANDGNPVAAHLNRLHAAFAQ
ncbi:DUF1465 family protein [Roseibium sp. RKSG952]|uniref:protease adaptor protein RcdA n=1 Tax=Roseibium sp. RKSG952 TaxID=2529384 RepID=UPI0012BB8D5B|nr:DUF1465 family protein [Roseibium sp. RKSG952]MTI00155.1 DUF1465 family protein [Roseibium sp. RKSG952]